MAWRFKASKYKNAAPIVPKPEACVRDITVGSYQTYGNNISASAAFMAFNVDHNGSSIAVLPIDDCGRKSKTMPLVHAHTDTVTDMGFSPFHDGLLATGSQDCLVKIWHIPKDGLTESITTPECTFSHRQRRVETVLFHPTAENLLTSTSFTTLTLWDILTEKEMYSNSEHSEVIQAVGWKSDGSLLATSCKDKQVRVLDPRGGCFTHVANSHQSIKDSRVVWLGSSNRILTTGFDANRLRQVYIRDLRNFEETEKALVLDSSTGILIPLFDPDTNMLFLAGKGDTTIAYMEVMDREPFLAEGIRHSGEQTKGACLAPKRALKVMEGEVNRVLQLTSTAVIPITYQVPRKSYRDFHADLFPDTAGCKTQLTAEQWMEGSNLPIPKISLDPSKRGNDNVQVHRGPLSELKKGLISKKREEEDNGKKKRKVEATANKPMSNSPLSEFESRRVSGAHSPAHNGSTCDDRAIQQPPKPLPRSRGSVPSEPTTVVEDTIPPPAAPPRPVARPRTAPLATSSVTTITPAPIFKPLLGPKPFTPPKLNGAVGDRMGSSSFSFDKVFSVPSVPELNGSKRDTADASGTLSEESLQTVSIEPPNEDGASDVDAPEVGKFSGEDSEGDGKVDDQDYDPLRTPTTAERRRLFERRAEEQGVSGTTNNQNEEDASPQEDGKEGLDGEEDVGDTSPSEGVKGGEEEERECDGDEVGDEEVDGFGSRESLQRRSIAERRKMYESRSASVQEGSTMGVPQANVGGPSPLPMRRRGGGDGPPSVQRQCSLESGTGGGVGRARREKKAPEPVPTTKRTSTVFGRVSKFRHLKGTPLHKSTHIENVRNISRQISGECDGFHANPDRVAVPLSGPGGKIAVFELSKTGKLPDGVIPTLVHGTNVMDFCWDPFDYSRLAVACDDGMIRLWKIPDGGLLEPTNEAECTLPGHSEKIYFIKFHPLASDVLASGSYDMTVRIWDLASGTERIILEGHTDQIFSFAWSPCGTRCATLCKDGCLRIYEPRKSCTPIAEGKGPVGARGARVVWALDGAFIVTTGFDKVSERQITVFKANDLATPLNTVSLDVSPAILIPFYDEDSSTLFLTGKGDWTIYAFEVATESPYLCPLSHHRCSGLHQGLSFLPKSACDIQGVEFAKALRLTNNTIEPISFTVPRLKVDYFQDDLFPPTKVTWSPTLTSEEWFRGLNRQPKRINLKPEGMENLSDVQGGSNAAPERTEKGGAKGSGSIANVPFNRLGWNPDVSGETKEKQEQIQRAVSSRMEVNLKLEQDDMEGVDEKEWDE
ncbi:coronin-7 isoform X1 [Hetaerina americana]|uniref:coronin-7 isoform X1 n=1 Tax=Hetaerina americana TaxID=62018 RepID=UPI003A7F5867